MPKAKKTPDAPQQGVYVPDVPKQGREIVYSILVPVSNQVQRKKAQDVLHNHHVPRNLIKVNDRAVSVPRLYGRWRGDDVEADWQRKIKDALPQAIIDVADWSHAPGYPKGDLSL